MGPVARAKLADIGQTDSRHRPTLAFRQLQRLSLQNALSDRPNANSDKDDTIPSQLKRSPSSSTVEHVRRLAGISCHELRTPFQDKFAQVLSPDSQVVKAAGELMDLSLRLHDVAPKDKSELLISLQTDDKRAAEPAPSDAERLEREAAAFSSAFERDATVLQDLLGLDTAQYNAQVSLRGACHLFLEPGARRASTWMSQPESFLTTRRDRLQAVRSAASNFTGHHGLRLPDVPDSLDAPLSQSEQNDLDILIQYAEIQVDQHTPLTRGDLYERANGRDALRSWVLNTERSLREASPWR